MPIHTEDLEYFRPAGAAPLLARFYRPGGPAFTQCLGAEAELILPFPLLPSHPQ